MPTSTASAIAGWGRFQRLSVGLQVAAFALVLFGIKLWVIRTYGNATPYWDQWDAEAAFLYDPFLQGKLGWLDFFSAHNEHRILTTRLTGLALLVLNGQWNPLLEMVINAALHVGTLGLSACLLAATIGRRFLPALLVFMGILFAVPYGWENTLAGFQTQFYFVLLSSVLAIWLLVRAEVFTRWWWVGVLLCVVAYFSLASGVFATAAVAGVLLMRCAVAGFRRKDLAAVALLGTLFVGGFLATPVIPGHASLKAAGAGELILALLRILAWPGDDGGFAAFLSGVLLRNLPLLVFVRLAIRMRLPRGDVRWYLVALVLWVCGQTASVAYGRAQSVLSSRYLDLHAMALVVGFASLLAVMTMLRGRWRKAWVAFALVWLAYAWMGLATRQLHELPVTLESKRAISVVQQDHVRDYLATHDRQALVAQPFHHIPYPDGNRLADLLDRPAIRAILPPNLQPLMAPASIQEVRAGFVPGGVFPDTPDCRCGAVGSYGPQGDAGEGELRMAYQPPPGSSAHAIVFSVAGYPSIAGSIELVQNGMVRPVRLARDPKERWKTVFVPIDPAPFEIRVRDTSKASWLAVGRPSLAGRLDRGLEAMLKNSLLFVAGGLALACFALSMDPLWRSGRTPAPDAGGPP